MKVTRNFTVTQRGIGKPDYTREIFAGKERPGLALKYNETLTFFGRAFSTLPSAFAWITSPLAAGDTASITDYETGFALPYTVLQGYTLAMITRSIAFTQDSISWLYLDGFLYACYGVLAGGDIQYDARVVEHGTHLLDPTGAASHLVDVKVTNLGGAAMEGAWAIRAILKAVGTEPLPTTKTVKCKFCGHEETVPRETTRWICPNCNQLNIYLDLSRFRGT